MLFHSTVVNLKKKEERLCEHVFGVVQLIQLLYNNNNKTRATKKNFSDDARAVKCHFLDKMSGGEFDDVISFYVCVTKITIYKIIKRLLYGFK